MIDDSNVYGLGVELAAMTKRALAAEAKLARVEELPTKWQGQSKAEAAQITTFGRGACFGLSSAAEELEQALSGKT